MKKLLTLSGLSLVFVLFLSFSMSAQRTISGTITDGSSNEPLIGANVLVSGSTLGTITDLDGSFSLSVPDNTQSLEISYAGYTTQTVPLGASNTVNINLSAGELLDEVVVTGYGVSKKSDLTGSIGSVKAEDFNGGIVQSPDQLVQGKISGVQVLNNSGQPGGETTFRIRGNSSVRTGNNPLFVVDGVPLDGRSARPGTNSGGLGTTPGTNPLNWLNPNDIASIDVLKDASATAIYGSRGANGVVIITTKKGRSGAPTIDANVSVGTSSILNRVDVLNGDEYRAALADYGIASTGTEDVDALGEILQTAITQNYTLSIGGGNDQGTYRISAGLLNNEGIVRESGLKKYTGSVNGSYSFFDNDRLKLDVNLVASHTENENAPISNNAGATGSLIGNALQWNPTVPLTQPDGSFTRLAASTINPLELISAFDDRDNVTTVLGSISPSFKIADGLTYKYLFSVNSSSGIRRGAIDGSLNLQNVEGRGLAAFNSSEIITTQHTHTLSYNGDLSSSVGISAVVGYEYQNFQSRGFGLTAQDFPLSELDFDLNNFLGATPPASSSFGSGEDPTTELQSFFGRVNVDIADNLLLTATVRADGSTKFGEDNRYGVFPSFAAAYKLDDILGSSPFDALKVRVGWGQVGNQEFPSGAAQETFGIGQGGSLFLQNVANPALRWETSTTLNAGIDFALFDYKLSGSIEYFNKTTEDLLFNFPTIQPAPAAFFWINLDGQVRNRGVELSLNTFVVDNDKLSVNIGGNISFLQNELTRYEGPIIETGALTGQGSSGALIQRLEEGQPLNSFFLSEFTGLDGDGGLSFANNSERVFLGDPNPSTLLGVSAQIESGPLSLALNFNGAFGHQVFNETFQSVLPIGNLGTRNIASILVESDIQEARSNFCATCSRYLESGSYLKLQNATLGYDFGAIGDTFSNVRLYLTGQNLLLFTGYNGFDPEVNTNKEANSIPSFGIEYIPYPSARSFILGANVSF